MKFFGRENQLNDIKQYLTLNKKANSFLLHIMGESGTGKTEVFKEAMKQNSSESYVLYHDVSIDTYKQNQLFELLITSSYRGYQDGFSCIPEKYAFVKYLNRYSDKAKQTSALVGALSHIIEIASPPLIGQTASSVVCNLHKEDNTIEDSQTIFFRYIKYLHKKTRITLVIDNYQFLDCRLRSWLENDLKNFNKGITFIVIERIKSISQLSFNLPFQKKEVNLSALTKEEFNFMVAEYDTQIQMKADAIYTATQGNLKDIDILIRNIKNNPDFKIMESKQAIKNLSAIEQSIILLASLLPAGLKEDYFIKIVMEIEKCEEVCEVTDKIKNLIRLGYVIKNGRNHDLIKPSHEKIITIAQNTFDINQIQHIRFDLKDLLESFVAEVRNTRDYGYMLHCLVGVIHATEAIKKCNYIEELIHWSYRNYEYFYIASMYSEIKNFIQYLSNEVIKKILISCQRVSDFTVGKEILKILKLHDPMVYKELLSFHIRFLTQTYCFEDALDIVSSIKGINNEYLMLKLNILQHLGKDEESMAELCGINNDDKDEHYFIILRNTAHLFNYEQALLNLNNALAYFDKAKATKFALATTYNNLSVIKIWHSDYNSAICDANKAFDILTMLQSNEIFEVWCNMGVIHLKNKNYDKCMQCFSKAKETCPIELTLDHLMLNINMVIAQMSAGIQSRADACLVLKRLSDENIVIDDPWYEFQLNYNLLTLSGCIASGTYTDKYLSKYNDGLTKYYIFHNIYIDNYTYKMCVGLSPNWRY